jgi:predicted phosphodiesterase
VKYLLLSDVHSNWEALQAVLRDSGGEYDRILSCGDLVGYGPEPNRTLNWARENVDIVVRGNHDRACCGLEDLEWFNPVARVATRWTIDKLTVQNADYLRNLPRGPVLVEDFLLVHGSPLDEDEYIVSMADASNVFPYLEAGVTFFGHTHVQGGFMWMNDEQYPVYGPSACEAADERFLDKDYAWLINPGSVGQPRDGDPRAAYCLYDSEKRVLQLRRVAYDTEAVGIRMVEAGLPPALGARLNFGR